jgi:hypothetical protein
MNDFSYYNINPEKSEEQDCVCRAISLAVNLDYHAVEKLLEVVAHFYNCEKLCLCCYHHLLEDVFNFPVRYCEYGETVGDIAKRLSHNIVLIRIDGHLSCSLYGIVYDIWDCSQKNVDCYWIVA